MHIYTGSFARAKQMRERDLFPISIAQKTPYWFSGPRCQELAPSWDLVMQYKEGHIDEAGYTARYVREVLSPLDAGQLLYTLTKLADNKPIVLCCWETAGDFCHRKLVAEWFKKLLPQIAIEIAEFDPLVHTNKRLKQTTAFFTGHRPQGFGSGNTWLLSGAFYRAHTFLMHELRRLITEEGFNQFISGAAQGVDTWAAEAVLLLQQEFPQIELCMAVPFPSQSRRWSDAAQAKHSYLCSRATNVVEVNSDPFTAWKFYKRNEWMVDHSARGIAIMKRDTTTGGTWHCVQYAKSHHIPVTIFDPTEN